MGIVHRLAALRPLTEDEARKCADACIGFTGRMQDQDLKACLEPPIMAGDPNKFILLRDEAGLRACLRDRKGGGFCCVPRGASPFSVHAGKADFSWDAGPDGGSPGCAFMACLAMACLKALSDSGGGSVLRFMPGLEAGKLKPAFELWERTMRCRAPDFSGGGSEGAAGRESA